MAASGGLREDSAVAVLSFLLGIIAVVLVWRFGREQQAGMLR